MRTKVPSAKPIAAEAAHRPAISNCSSRRLLPVKVAAERLGLSVWGVRGMCYDGRLASHKLGVRLMVAEDEIDRVIAESERPRRKTA